MAEYLEAEKKQEIFAKYGKSNKDTGSPESQVALFSYRIAHLTQHMKANHKDHGTQRALLKLASMIVNFPYSFHSLCLSSSRCQKLEQR